MYTSTIPTAPPRLVAQWMIFIVFKYARLTAISYSLYMYLLDHLGLSILVADSTISLAFLFG